jgi:hypothetical protein
VVGEPEGKRTIAKELLAGESDKELVIEGVRASERI